MTSGPSGPERVCNLGFGGFRVWRPGCIGLYYWAFR